MGAAEDEATLAERTVAAVQIDTQGVTAPTDDDPTSAVGDTAPTEDDPTSAGLGGSASPTGEHLGERDAALAGQGDTQDVSNIADSGFSFDGSGYQVAAFAPVSGISRISGRIRSVAGGRFGFAFALDDDFGSDCLVVFNQDSAQLHYYNASVQTMRYYRPQVALDFDISDETEFTIYIDGSVLVMYLDGHRAFSTRIHSMQNRRWGIFSLDARVQFSALRLATLAHPRR